MSKFDKVFEARNTVEEKQSVSAEETPPKQKKNVRKSALPPVNKTVDTKVLADEDKPHKLSISEPRKQRGRPKAKRSDPAYVGFTTYIRRDTHLKAKIALLQEGHNRELSELVESLLVDWLKTKH